jgi:hypothetical protein
MTPAQIELARRRLWLGITNVGFWVLAACAGLWWLAVSRAEAPSPQLVLAIGAGMIAGQAVFDFIGGALLMPEPRPAITVFLAGWSRGLIGHTLVMAGVGLLSYASFGISGGFCFAILLATAGLALGRRALFRALTGVSTQEVPLDGGTILTADPTDPAFTGGIVRLGRRARSLLPVRWLANLPPEELAAETSRRQWQMRSGLPGRAFILVLGWNLLGAHAGTLAWKLAERPPAAALLGHACWMTLWAFGGLLVLPALSRLAVFAADRAAAEAGCDPRPWIARFPSLVGEDGSSISAVQTVFYPIPSAPLRLRELEKPRLGFVPGNLARSNLYYSWATLTLLGRAVHCNVGRPALWVFPPSA